MLIVFALVKESNRVLLIQERKIMFFTAAQDHIQSEFHTGWPAGPILDITGCDDRTQSSALRFKKIIFVRNVENSICLEGASKQNALFSKKCPPPKKNAPMPSLPGIGPDECGHPKKCPQKPKS